MHVRYAIPESGGDASKPGRLPLPDASVDVVVSFQVIEHLWDQARSFCARVLQGSGTRWCHPTGSPPRPRYPTSTHSTRLNADRLTSLLIDAEFVGGRPGLFHGHALREHGRPPAASIDARIMRAVAGAPWPPSWPRTSRRTTADFEMVAAGHGRDIVDNLRSDRDRGAARDTSASPVPGLFTLVLPHSPAWLAHHGRWPVGEWLYIGRGRRPAAARVLALADENQS